MTDGKADTFRLAVFSKGSEMASPEKISNALAQLNTQNDAQWTADGAPKLEAVRFLAKDASITREDIVQVAPNFSRVSAAFVKDGDVPQSIVEMPLATERSELQLAHAALADAEAAVSDANKVLAAAREALDKLLANDTEKEHLSDQVSAVFARSDELRKSLRAAGTLAPIDAARMRYRGR